MRLLTLVLTLTLLTFLPPTVASANTPRLSLNGVDITGVRDQRFENCTVTIDANGNIQLHAPQYKVEVQTPSATAATAGQTAAAQASPPAPAAISDSHYVVVTSTQPNGSNFDIDIYINGALHRTFKNSDSQLVLDISGRLHAGTNTVALKARKLAGTSPTAASNSIEVIVGRGTSAGNQLTIERQHGTFKVVGTQSTDQAAEITFNVN